MIIVGGKIGLEEFRGTPYALSLVITVQDGDHAQDVLGAKASGPTRAHALVALIGALSDAVKDRIQNDTTAREHALGVLERIETMIHAVPAPAPAAAAPQPPATAPAPARVDRVDDATPPAVMDVPPTSTIGQTRVTVKTPAGPVSALSPLESQEWLRAHEMVREAERATAHGDSSVAKACYVAAAEIFLQQLRSLRPNDYMPTTRGILALQAVIMFARGQDRDRAIQVAEESLATGAMSEHYTGQVAELLRSNRHQLEIDRKATRAVGNGANQHAQVSNPTSQRESLNILHPVPPAHGPWIDVLEPNGMGRARLRWLAGGQYEIEEKGADGTIRSRVVSPDTARMYKVIPDPVATDTPAKS